MSMRLDIALSTVLLAAASVLAACSKTPTPGQTSQAAAPSPQAAGAAPTSSAAALRVALYPGLQPLVEAHRIALDKSGYMVVADFKSDDAPDKVAAFYRAQLGKQFGDKTEVQEIARGEGMTSFQSTDGQGQGSTVLVRPESTGTVVGIQTLVKTN
jgi:hypothetical protein